MTGDPEDREMSCEEVREALGEGGEKERISKHRARCPLCAEKRDQMTATLDRLKAVSLPALPSGFDDRLRQRLESVGSPDTVLSAPRHERRRGFPTALVLGISGIVIALGALIFSKSGQEGAPLRHIMPAAAASIAVSVPATLVLTFQVEKPKTAVEIRITAPLGVRLIDAVQKEGERSDLVLRRDFVAGQNDVPFTLMGEKPGSYRLVAKAITPEAEVSQEVYLQVTK